MNVDALEEMIEAEIQKGNHPFFVNSCAGTTVMGSFDDHTRISALAKKHGMWYNIDACWGGFLIF